MKNTDKHIDALFKRLEDDHFTVPQSFLDDLNKRLDSDLPQAKTRKRFGFWLLFSAVVGLLMASLTIVHYHFDTDSEAMHSQNARVETKENKRLSTSDADRQANQPEASGGGALLSDDSKKNATSTEKPLGQSDNDSYVSSTFQQDSNLSRQRGSTTDSPSRSDGAKGVVDPGVHSSSAFGDSHSAVKDPNSESISQKSDDVITKNPALNPFGFNVEPGVLDGQQEANSFYISTQLKGIDLDFGREGVYSEPMHERNEFTPEKGSKQWLYDIQVYGGASHAFWKTKPNANSVQADLDSRFILSPTFGLKTNVFYKNMNASLGLEYYRFNQKLVAHSNTIEQTGVDSVIVDAYMDSIYIDSVWYYDTVYVFGYQPDYDTVTRTQPFTNAYTWLSIPISFGYRFNSGPWSFIPRAGVSLNIGIAQNIGNYADLTGTIQQFEAVKFNCDVVVQTEIRRNFNTFHVFATPYYRVNLSPMLTAPSFSVSHQSWGVNLGLGIDL